MSANEERPREGWLQPNRTENHATTFSHDPAGDRAALVGVEGETVTTLRPTGEIQIKGRLYNAVAEGTFIDSGERIRVTGSRDFRVTVEKIA